MGVPTSTGDASGASVGGFDWARMLQPRWLARLLATRQGSVVFAVVTPHREVALTFDDGPHHESTARLLDVLHRHGARATFFMIGSHVRDLPEVVADVARAGHELGNHLWVDRPSVLSGADEFEQDLLRTHRLLERAGPGRPVLVRPASGWFRPVMLRLARRHGYRMALGSVTTPDLRLEDPERSLRLILGQVQPGAVIVLHDRHPHPETLARFTGALLDGLHAAGLRAVTLSDLLARAG